MSGSSGLGGQVVVDDEIHEAAERLRSIAIGPDAANELAKLDKESIFEAIIALVYESVAKDDLSRCTIEQKDQQLELAAKLIASKDKEIEWKTKQLELDGRVILSKNDELAQKNATIAHLNTIVEKPVISNGNVVRALIQEWETRWPDFQKISWWMAQCTEMAGAWLHQNSIMKQLRSNMEVKVEQLQHLKHLAIFQQVVDVAHGRHAPLVGSDESKELGSMWIPDSNVMMDDSTIQQVCLNAVRAYKQGSTCDCPGSAPGKARLVCNVCTFKDKKDGKARKASGAQEDADFFRHLQSVEAADTAGQAVNKSCTASRTAEAADGDTDMDQN
ncbi:MAG: hypothetical protein M1812_005451 [Candelaria pacifica]|nr:MAG: hypothetical protein M1812_005451 [Candelaria pacifica]